MRLKLWAWHSFLATLFPLDSQTGMRELSQRTSFFLFFFYLFPGQRAAHHHRHHFYILFFLPPLVSPGVYLLISPSNECFFSFSCIFCVYVSAQQFQLRRKNVDNSFESRTISDWTTQFRLVTKKTVVDGTLEGIRNNNNNKKRAS